MLSLPNFKISNFLDSKIKSLTHYDPEFVYKFHGERCISIYVGKTTRHTSSRIKEHLEVSFRTGLRLTSSPYNAIGEHVINNNHSYTNFNLSENQFTVLTSAASDFDLCIKENLYIKKLRPHLNDLESVKLRVFNNSFFL